MYRYPPRPTRAPFKCRCGRVFYTSEAYYTHIENCDVHQKWLKEIEKLKEEVK